MRNTLHSEFILMGDGDRSGVGKVRPAEVLNTARGVVSSTQFPYTSCYYDVLCLIVWPKHLHTDKKLPNFAK